MAPPALRDRQQWLVWRFEKDPKKEKPLKVPYYANGRWDHKRHGDQGSPDDRIRLVTHAEAMKHAPPAERGGIGFAFLPGDGLIGIDLDKVIDLATGEISERARNIIKECDSYTEYSPSKTGVHIIGAGDTAFLFEDGKTHSFKSNKIGVEVFCGAQYFTFTGERYSGTPDDVRPLTENVLRRLYATVKPRKSSSPAAASVSPMPADNDYRRADGALAYIDADEYQTWIDIGHALKHAFGEAAFSLWDRWSQKSAKYPGMTESAKKWATLNPNGSLKLGTVFELAKRGGWSPPRTSKRNKPAESPEPPPPDREPPGDDGGAGDPGDDRPLIRWEQGKLPEVVDAAESALVEAGIRIYQRAGFLVRVVQRDTPSVRNYKRRPPGTLGILNVDTPYLVESMTRAARWEKWNSRKNDWHKCNAPEQAATTYMARRGHWKLPLLWSAISTPTLRPDGTVLQTPGYDAEMQAWYDPCGIAYPAIPESPTRDDAASALEKLGEAFESFPFESGADRAVALSLALTALVRRSLPSAPLGAITAPVMESGKTLLADCFSILGVGTSAPAMAYADTEEEFNKTMLAILADGDQVVLIDNVERTLEGATLCAVLTSEAFRQRVLGRTEMMSVPTTTLFLATGNHLVIAGDLRTRALLCRIDPKVEHPGQRHFEIEKRIWMSEHRPELVAAGLTIMRAFIATEQLVQDHCKTWGRFERWSDRVRAPLIWLGCEDPCASRKDLEREDPERTELARVMAAWLRVFSNNERSARDAIQAGMASLTEDEKALNLALLDVCKGRDGSLDSRRFGHWLRKHTGRIVEGKQFEKVREKDHTMLYRVTTMTPTG